MKGRIIHVQKSTCPQDKTRGGWDAPRAIAKPSCAPRFAGGKSRAALAVATSLWMAIGGVASAEDQTAGDGQTVEMSTMSSGDTQTINSGGTGTVEMMGDGVQEIWGLGTVEMMYGGRQLVHNGGSGTVDTMDGGWQVVDDGGSGTVDTMDGGEQDVYPGGSGTVYMMNNGVQVVIRGTGTVDTMNGGVQQVRGGSGTVETMTDGIQYVYEGGSGTVYTMNGGTQVVSSGGTGFVGVMAGGTLSLEAGAKVESSVRGHGAISGGVNLSTNQVSVSGGTMKADALTAAGVEVADGGALLEVTGDLATEKLTFSAVPTTGVLVSAGGAVNAASIDISGLDMGNRTRADLMRANTIGDATLICADGTATLDSAHSSQIVKETAKQSDEAGVTLDYSETHTVSLTDSGTTLAYAVANTATAVTFGEMTWGTGRDADGICDFANIGNETIDATNLKFTNPEDATGSMTLLSNATGLTAGDNIAHTQNFTKDANGATLSATLSGNVIRTTADEIGYEATGTTLDSVDLAAWNGTASAVPTGWTANASGVVVAGNAANPGLGVGESTNILTATEGYFTNADIDEAVRYKENVFADSVANGVTLSGKTTGGVKATENGAALAYYATAQTVETVSLGAMAWDEKRAAEDAFDFRSVSAIDAGDLSFTFTDEQKAALSATSNMTLLDNATNLTAGKTVANANRTQAIDFAASNGAALSGTLAGAVATTAGAVNYQAASMTLDSVNLANWNGTASAVPTGWTANLGDNSITATGFTAPTLAPETTTDILTTETANFFADSQITGEHQYKAHAFTEDTPTNGVAFSGTQSRGVKASEDGMNLVYAVESFDVETVSLGETAWNEGRTATAGYNYTNANIDFSKFAFENPETISAGTTTLLQANNTLADIAATEKNLSYIYAPVAGVTMDGKITGSYEATGGNLSYTATANQATKLTFADVEWKDSGALLDHAATLTSVSFNGADVDTSNINFTNLQALQDNKKMTLVSSFGDTVGTITGTKYKVGSTLEGTGKASLVDGDLIFTTDAVPTDDGGTDDSGNSGGLTVQEQTHNTVMGATVSLATLSAGNDFIGSATEGLAQVANIGDDGISSYANIGGGTMRQETGSHVDTHHWNAILAIGKINKKEKSTFEYGAFFEYGSGNYTTHNGDQRGDGSARYAGGGLLAKWTAKHGLYVEGSLRAGTVHDDARNVLRNANGVPYSYETNANYFGGHVGIGKEIPLANGNTVDVYGKYFVNRRNSVSFNAGGHYDLDAVTSQIARIGVRYTVKGKKWNFYAGAAYEHELDGKATGKADGMAIRGADPSGASFRGELGATMTPGENSPWKLDLNVTGFAGKKQGVTGGVSVAWMF